MTPGPSLAGVRLILLTTSWGLPCCVRFPCVHAVATTPAQRLGASSAHFPSRASLPRYGSRVGPRIDLFEACSAFTRVTACTLALSPIRDTHNRRLQLLRYLHSCSGCFRLEHLPGGVFTHWESAAFPRRTPMAVLHWAQLSSVELPFDLDAMRRLAACRFLIKGAISV